MIILKHKGLGIILLTVIIILMTSHVISLGMLPASQNVLLGKDPQTFSIFILNDNKNAELNVYAEGTLSEYIELDKTKITLTQNKDKEEIKIRIKDIPSNIVPGEHVVKIIVSDTTQNSGQISASISLSFRLTIIIPYDDAYLDVSLFAPNFDTTKGGNFVIQTQNKGSNNAVDVVPIIDIYSSTNHKVATLRGDSKLIKAGEMVNFAIPLTENLQNGKYLAKASLVYSGKSTSDEKTFTIGSPNIVIDSISTSTFRLGGIAGFDIFLMNNWGEELSVFANVEFRKDNQLLEATTTATTQISPMSRSRLQAYWDTSGLPTGMYEVLIKLNYLDKIETTSHNIKVESDKIMTGTGNVVESKEKSDSLPLLILVIFVLVLLNAFLIYKFVIKKKGDAK